MLILRQLEAHYLIISGGLFAVIVGLMFFMEGLKRGLMPFGTVIGRTLPRNSSLPVVLLITLLLGIGVTFAEPAIGALKAVGRNVAVDQAPYLYAMLNEWSDILVLVVGASVGLAAVLGTLRFLYGWCLKPMIYMALAPVLGLTLFAAVDPQLQKIVELGWTPGRSDRYFKKVSLTYWHVDERVNAGVSQGDGFAFTTNWTFDKKLMVFLRGGKGDGADANRLLEKDITLGFIRRFFKSDLLGFGYNVGEPTGLVTINQQVSELFYRLQLSQGIAITPSIQLLIDPANNPSEDRIWVAGVRARLTL